MLSRASVISIIVQRQFSPREVANVDCALKKDVIKIVLCTVHQAQWKAHCALRIV